MLYNLGQAPFNWLSVCKDFKGRHLRATKAFPNLLSANFVFVHPCFYTPNCQNQAVSIHCQSIEAAKRACIATLTSEAT